MQYLKSEIYGRTPTGIPTGSHETHVWIIPWHFFKESDKGISSGIKKKIIIKKKLYLLFIKKKFRGFFEKFSKFLENLMKIY